MVRYNLFIRPTVICPIPILKLGSSANTYINPIPSYPRVRQVYKAGMINRYTMKPLKIRTFIKKN